MAPAEACTRESIEVRTVAFFPDCPGYPNAGLFDSVAFPTAHEVAEQLLRQLDTPELWPLDMRAWLRKSVDREPSVTASSLIKQMVEWNSDPGNPDGMISNAPAELVREVARLL